PASGHDDKSCNAAGEAPTIDKGSCPFDSEGPRTYHGATPTGRGARVAEEKLYSLTEIADSLGLAEPTARRYRDAFEEFLPSVGVGRRRKFTDQAKLVLARIATLVHEQRMPVEVVRRILSSER